MHTHHTRPTDPAHNVEVSPLEDWDPFSRLPGSFSRSKRSEAFWLSLQRGNFPQQLDPEARTNGQEVKSSPVVPRKELNGPSVVCCLVHFFALGADTNVLSSSPPLWSLLWVNNHSGTAGLCRGWLVFSRSNRSEN